MKPRHLWRNLSYEDRLNIAENALDTDLDQVDVEDISKLEWRDIPKDEQSQLTSFIREHRERFNIVWKKITDSVYYR